MSEAPHSLHCIEQFFFWFFPCLALCKICAAYSFSNMTTWTDSGRVFERQRGEYITDWVAYVYNRLGNLLHSFASFTPSFECRLHLKPCDICHAKHWVSNVYYIKKHVLHMALKCVLNRKACYTHHFPMCIKSKSMLYAWLQMCITSKSMLYT